jgi:hypothetical protein
MELKNHTAEEYLSNIHQSRLLAIHALNQVAHKIHVPPSTWKEGQLVWLKGKNLPLPYGSVKLAPWRHGPFKIIKIISLMAVQLELLIQWNIHPVFHTSLIMPYTETPSHGPNFTQPPPDLIDGEEEYEVEQICAHQRWGCHKTLQYLIKWKGYPESNNTWENADQVHAPSLIRTYHRTKPLESIKARHLHLSPHHPLSPLPSETLSPPLTPLSTIIRDTTTALVWSDVHKDNIRSACSPLPLPQALCPQVPLNRITPHGSSVILMETASTSQTFTTNNDNSLFPLPHHAPSSSTQCPPTAHSTCQTSHTTKAPSNCHLTMLRHRP